MFKSGGHTGPSSHSNYFWNFILARRSSFSHFPCAQPHLHHINIYFNKVYVAMIKSQQTWRCHPCRRSFQSAHGYSQHCNRVHDESLSLSFDFCRSAQPDAHSTKFCELVAPSLSSTSPPGGPPNMPDIPSFCCIPTGGAKMVEDPPSPDKDPVAPNWEADLQRP